MMTKKEKLRLGKNIVEELYNQLFLSRGELILNVEGREVSISFHNGRITAEGFDDGNDVAFKLTPVDDMR
jgi:hypothetical protein